MKKTEKEIREMFKDAHECVDIYGDNFVMNLSTLCKPMDDYYCRDEEGRISFCIYSPKTGLFAKILTYKNKVTESDLIGDIAGFPIEVVQKMCDEQVRQGNKFDVEVFQDRRNEIREAGGFSWSDSLEGIFWYDVIRNKNFDIFFDKYPKQTKNTITMKTIITSKFPDNTIHVDDVTDKMFIGVEYHNRKHQVITVENRYRILYDGNTAGMNDFDTLHNLMKFHTKSTFHAFQTRKELYEWLDG